MGQFIHTDIFPMPASVKKFAKRFKKHKSKDKASKAFIYRIYSTKDRVFGHEFGVPVFCLKQETTFDTQVLFNDVNFIHKCSAEVGLGWWLFMMMGRM